MMIIIVLLMLMFHLMPMQIISSPIIIIIILFPHLLLIISRLIVLACGCLPLPVKSDTHAGFCPRLEVVMRKRSGNLADDQLKLYTCILHTLILLLGCSVCAFFQLWMLSRSWWLDGQKFFLS